MIRIPGLPPRFAAWRILHDVRHGVPFDVALKRAVRDLEPEDRRLAHELAAGVFRNRTALDRTLGSAIERGIDSVRADALDVLRLGAFQLTMLDRVPPHAAVQTTVGVARRLGGRRIAGFINAVLRRLAADLPDRAAEGAEPNAGGGSPETDGRGSAAAGGTSSGARAVGPGVGSAATDPGAASRLAERYSHPEWLVARWVARYGAAETEGLLVWNNTRPRLVLQPARWKREDLERALAAAGVGFEPAPFDAGLVVSVRKPADLPGFREGGFLVQDPAQRLVTRFFAPKAASLIYDACSAPGGKAVALAPRARLLVAADRTRARVRKLADTVDRAGCDRIHPIVADATRPPVRQVDAVVLDVPCLGTGTFARNPDARWRVTPEALARLAAQAADFLAVAADLVTPGGLLLFATCSLEAEENEAQIERFLSGDSRFRREPPANVPAELLTPAGDLSLLPQSTGTDGAYAARLRKASE